MVIGISGTACRLCGGQRRMFMVSVVDFSHVLMCEECDAPPRLDGPPSWRVGHTETGR